MSRYFSQKFASLVPYTPGEQPKERRYIKLNTNESPFPPSPKAIEKAAEAARNLQLYSDPTATLLHRALGETYHLPETMFLATNGSDEILNFAFMAFCDETRPAVFPDITYGFYEVFAEINRIPYQKIPLKDDLSIDVGAMTGLRATVFLANPNAPTGLLLSLDDVETIVRSTDGVVVVDEAYIDFGGESAISLLGRYDNLLVTRTFSKSRSMAGARLGFGIADPTLIADLNAMKYATNPYNVNAMTMAAGIGCLCDEAYTLKNCETIIENRKLLSEELLSLGFSLTDSMANFVFAKHPRCSGSMLYEALREAGILVRHFNTPRIADYLRITVGSRTECEALIEALKTVIPSFSC
ncbi:MAG: histidinol-phosphate transaminase [Clostridia bacterium]|nr:histidinol-phosphate transaminase [Clostridia bacterium]